MRIDPGICLDGVEEGRYATGVDTLFARRGDLTPLEEGEWFADDLVGLPVVDRSGAAVGTVVRLVNLPSVDVLEVAPEGGGPGTR